MEDIDRIWLKYEDGRILDRLESLDEVNRLALTFASDAAQTFCLLTQMRNPSRNPAGYSLSDAPIVGLLTRVAKLFRLICRFYELRNGEYLSMFSRPLIESAIIATYLLREGDAAVEDFRRCSYKDTLRILRARESGAEFFRTDPGQRVLQSALDDLALENLSPESFAQQRRNHWRLQGKTLYDIFAEVASPDEFPFVYGMLSESIHGSWNESMDWCLSRNDDGTFSTYALYEDVAEILDILSRMKNVERNPTGFSIDDAPILGLLVRTWKLLKLVVWIYKEDSAEYAVIAERSLIEVAVTATYLLRSGSSTMEDYRRCSYGNRFKILEQAASGAVYYHSKPGRRLLRSIRDKLALEGLDENSFEQQIAHGWRLGGQKFRRIFEDVMGEDLYAVAYGASSESVHGSWRDIRGYSLAGDPAHGFYPLYTPLRVDIGTVSMIVPFATLPFREWVTRVQLDDQYIGRVLDFVDRLNGRLFSKYGKRVYGF